MNRAVRFYRSSVGKKAVMAVTGLVGIAFVTAHAAGNMLTFAGREALNSYSHLLKSSTELLWLMRAGLIAAVILHVLAAYQLTLQNRAARPVDYERLEPQVSTVAARSMRLGGVLLLVFIIIHILHFTTGSIRPAGVFSPSDVYLNVVESFRIWWVTLFYVAAMVALGAHLYHGAWSSVRSVGMKQPSPSPLRRRIAGTIALLILLGFVSVPLAVFFGLVR